MLKTYLYIPEELDNQINFTAQAQNKSKAEVIRQALKKGIGAVIQQGAVSAKALLKIAEVGEMHQPQGPEDLSANLDNYLWGIKK